MPWTLDEAKAECERWFAYLEREENKLFALQKLASERRRGLVDDKEGRRRRAEIQGAGVTVYDGGNLRFAVKAILKHISASEKPHD